MTAEDFKPPDVEVWPENMLTVDVFLAMRTQWRFSQFGATGLDYGVLPTVLDLMEVPKADRSEIFEGVKAMETVELISMRRKMRAHEAENG